jgi:hypothetical protein
MQAAAGRMACAYSGVEGGGARVPDGGGAQRVGKDELRKFPDSRHVVIQRGPDFYKARPTPLPPPTPPDPPPFIALPLDPSPPLALPRLLSHCPRPVPILSLVFTVST